MAQFRTTSPVYVHLKGDVPGKSSPTFIEEGTTIGTDTAFDFEGPPSRGMVPLDDEAQALMDEAEGAYVSGPATVKGTSAAPEGGAKPFDPASGETGESEADKAAAKKKADDAEAAAKAKAAADAKNSKN